MPQDWKCACIYIECIGISITSRENWCQNSLRLLFPWAKHYITLYFLLLLTRVLCPGGQDTALRPVRQASHWQAVIIIKLLRKFEAMYMYQRLSNRWEIIMIGWQRKLWLEQHAVQDFTIRPNTTRLDCVCVLCVHVVWNGHHSRHNPLLHTFVYILYNV